MKILVTGGRAADPWEVCDHLHFLLDDRTDIECIIEGGAKGADRGARYYAQETNKMVLTFSADWEKYGKSAGFIRNKQMRDEGQPDLIIAFPGGAGTKMMIELGEEKNIPIHKVGV